MIPANSRAARTWIGLAVIVVSVVVFGYQGIFLKDTEFGAFEIGVHLLMLFAGLMMFDPKIAKDFIAEIGKAMPWGKS
jgi:hypothetical protein